MIGIRVTLQRDVDRYPNFVARAGSTGTITRVDADEIHVKLDRPLPGAEEWDNCVIWDRGTETLPQFAEDTGIDELAILCGEYEAWNKTHGLKLGSADEHLCDENLTDAQRLWLCNFSQRWEAAERRLRA